MTDNMRHMIGKVRRFIHAALLLTISSIVMVSCHDVPEYANDPEGNFEALWTIIDEHYCFLREKGVDWDRIHREYREKISPDMTGEELFNVCAMMLAELRDGHTNLASPWETSYYRQWWSDYPQNYDSRLIEEHYFNFNYRQVSGIKYGILPRGNIGYMGYSSFATLIGEGNLDSVLAYLITCDGLVIDLRDNGGGNMTMVETLVSRFITSHVTAGFMIHKTGPGIDDFSQPLNMDLIPLSRVA